MARSESRTYQEEEHMDQDLVERKQEKEDIMARSESRTYQEEEHMDRDLAVG